MLYSHERLGCSYCYEAKHLNTHTAKGIYLDKDWIQTKVIIYGTSKKAIKSDIRKKVFNHLKTRAHIFAEEILRNKDKFVITNVIDKQNSKFFQSSNRLFNTAYFLLKNNRPFSDYLDLIQLQSLNGIAFGKTLHSR